MRLAPATVAPTRSKRLVACVQESQPATLASFGLASRRTAGIKAAAELPLPPANEAVTCAPPTAAPRPVARRAASAVRPFVTPATTLPCARLPRRDSRREPENTLPSPPPCRFCAREMEDPTLGRRGRCPAASRVASERDSGCPGAALDARREAVPPITSLAVCAWGRRPLPPPTPAAAVFATLTELGARLRPRCAAVAAPFAVPAASSAGAGGDTGGGIGSSPSSSSGAVRQ